MEHKIVEMVDIPQMHKKSKNQFEKNRIEANLIKDERPVYQNIQRQSFEDYYNKITQQYFSTQNQHNQDQIKRESDLSYFERQSFFPLNSCFPLNISFNTEEISNKMVVQQEDNRNLKIIEILSQMSLLRESLQFLLTDGIIQWLRKIFFSSYQFNSNFLRENEKLIDTFLSLQSDYTLILLDQPSETTRESFLETYHLPSKISFFIERINLLQAEQEKVEITLTFQNVLEYLDYRQWFKEKMFYILQDQKFNKTKEILQIFLLILKVDDVNFTICSEIETIVFDMSKCSSNVISRITQNGSLLQEMTVILHLGRSHSFNILQTIINELKKSIIKCKRVVIQIEDCEEEIIMDYLTLIQQSKIKSDTILLEVLGRDTLELKLESLILEIIGKNLIKVNLKSEIPNSKQNGLLVFEKEQRMLWQFETVIQIELQKEAQINQNNSEKIISLKEKQAQGYLKAVEITTQKGVIEGLEAILNKKMQFYGTTNVKIIGNKITNLEICVSICIETDQNSKEILRNVVNSLMQELLENQLQENKLSFTTFEYQNLKERDSNYVLDTLRQLKGLKTIKLSIYQEEVTFDLSIDTLFSTTFNYNNHSELILSVLKWPIQKACLILDGKDTLNDLTKKILQITTIDCLREVNFKIRIQNRFQADQIPDKMCNLIIALASKKTLAKLSVSCTDSNLICLVSFELDRQSKTISFRPAEYSYSVIYLLVKNDSCSDFLEAENLKLTLNNNFLFNNKYDVIDYNGNINKNGCFGQFIEKFFKRPKRVEISLIDDHPLDNQLLLLNVILQLNSFSAMILDVPNLKSITFNTFPSFNGLSQITSIKIRDENCSSLDFHDMFKEFPSLLNIKFQSSNSKHLQSYYRMKNFLNKKKILVGLLADKECWPVTRIETLYQIFLNYIP